MKKIVLLFCLYFTAVHINAQSNDCSTATNLTPGATCVNTAGTVAGATQSIPGCVGTADDDVWYQFTATSTSHQITVTPSASFDPVVQLFSGGCSALATISCMDNTNAGVAETINATTLTVGQVYKIRVYDYFSGVPATTTFSICVTNPPVAPGNDACTSATLLNVNTSCTTTSGTSVGATQSYAGCAGTADDDVWYRFVATNSVQTITVNPSANMDAVVELYSGTCGASTLTSITCMDNGFTAGVETINAVGLIPGNTYYVRVYDYYASTGGAPFTICVTGAASATPSNDEPCNAIQWPAVTTECNYLNFTTAGATTTATPGAPSATCQNWDAASGTYIAATSGGYGAGTKDVWFKITVPSTGNLTITTKPGLVSPVNDLVFVLYTGTCGALTQIACSDDYNYPSSGSDMQPFLNQTGLTPGATVYLRVFCYGTVNSGNFGFCVSTNTNDACANALYICDLNGYSASTSAAFTPDRPGTGAGQMFGNNENSSGVKQPTGTNTGGPFGQAPSFNPAGGSPAFDVTIQNNSWIRFTASATTAVLNVTVSYCFVGSYPSGGIQMQIFSATNCNNFVPVSNFMEGSSAFTITAQGLTVGQDYYLMVDGYAGDVCNYKITANSGVQFPDIVASANPICTGASTTLTAPNGASSYEWYPGGQTTQAITVSPSTTMTYTCIVAGVCGQRQTLTKTITVNQLPQMTSTATPAAICSGTSVGLTLTSDNPSTFSWIAANNANITGESTTPQTGSVITNTLVSSSSVNEIVTYSVTPTSVSGSCVGSTQTVSVTVKPKPTLSAISNQTVCGGNAVSAINYSASPAGTTVNWTNTNTNIGIVASGTGNIAGYSAPTVTSAQTGTITATPSLNGCTGTAQQFTITINPTPIITAPSNITVCGGALVSVPVYTVSPSSTINWTNGNTAIGNLAASGLGNVPSFTAATPAVATSSTITANTTLAGCSATPKTFVITVNPAPVMNPVTSQTVCAGGAVSGINFSTNPAVGPTYIWSNNNTAIGVAASGTTPIAAYTAPSVATQQIGSFTVTPTMGSCSGPPINFSITINPKPTINPVSNVTACGNSTVNPINFSSTPATSVSWSSSGTSTGLATANGTGNTPSFTAANVASSTQSTITLNTTASGCSATPVTFTITVNPTPSINSVTSQTVCSGSAVSGINFSTLPASGPTYIWSNNNTNIGVGASGSTNIASYTAPPVTSQQIGSFTVTPSMGSCSGTPVNFSITINPKPTINPVSNVTACGNSTINAINFSSTPATSVSWSSSGTSTGLAVANGTNNTPSFTAANVTSSTQSTITLNTTSSGCSATPVTFTITVNPTPSVNSVTSQTVCSGSSVNAINFTTVPAVGPTYTWVNINPNIGIGTTGNSNIPSYTAPPVGSQEVGVISVTPSMGSCTGNPTVFSVTINPKPVITAVPNTTVCGNSLISGASFSVSPNTNVNWTSTNAAAVGLGTASGTNSVPGFTAANVTSVTTATVNLNATLNGCSATQVPYTITVNPLPRLTVTPTMAQSICNGSTGSLTGANVTGTGSLTYSWTNSANAPVGNTLNLSNMPAGSYNLTAVDANCSATFGPFSITNPGAPAQPTITFNDNNLCVGQSLSLTASSTATTPTYAWSGPNSSSATNSLTIGSVTLADGGTYTISVTESNCTSTNTVSIIVNPNPTAVASNANNVYCSGTTVNLYGSGGTSYSWVGPAPNNFTSSSQNPQLVSSTQNMSGTYTLTVTDAQGCSNTDTTKITVNPTPGVTNVAATNATICEGAAINLTASSAGATSYSWVGPNAFTSNQQNPTIANASTAYSGTYTVIATALNCSALPATVSVTVNPNPIANISIESSVYCSGSTISLFGSGGGTYSWTGPAPNNFTSSLQNPQLTPSTSNMTGTYTLTVTSPEGCSNSTTQGITVNPTPGVIDVSAASNNICEGATINLFANFSNATDYYWEGPNSYTSTQQNPIITNAGVLNSGTYTVTASNPNCTSQPEIVTVTINANPIAFASNASNVYCSGSTIDLLGSGGGTYSWTGPAPNNFTSSMQNPQLTSSVPNMSGTYTLTVTTPEGCSDTATTTLLVNQTPGVITIAAAADSICDGADIALTASSVGANTYTWTGPNSYTSNQQNPTIVGANTAQSGTYTVIASALNCNTQPATITVIVSPNPTISTSISGSTICSGTDVTLSASGGISYSWTGPNSFTSSSQNPSLTNTNSQMSGTYTVNVTNSANCSGIDSVSLLVNTTPDLPVITANSDTLCEGKDLQLNANSTNGAGYSWIGPNGFTASVSNPIITSIGLAQSGTYSVSAVNSSTPACTSAVATILVVVNPTPNATAFASANTLCSGNTVVLYSSGGTNYSWTGPNGYTSTQANDSITNAGVSASGTYTFTAINMPGNCTDTATVSILVNQTPSAANVMGASTCHGNSLFLTANGNGVANWYYDSTLTSFITANDTLYPVLPPDTTVTYYVTISSNGCTSTSIPVTASNYNINAAFAASPDSGYVPLTVSLTNNSTGVGQNDSYNWTVDNSPFSTGYNANYFFEQGGTFTVSLVITDNASGCMDTASVTIFVNDEIHVVIPNIFTPNHDNINDVFALDIKGAKEAQGYIYNRWGSLLHSWDAINSVWDGKLSNGEWVSDGIYFYIIKIIGYNGDKKDVPGNVTIVR